MKALRHSFLIAHNTLMEALRQRFLLAIALMALVAIAAGKLLLAIELGGSPQQFLADIGLASMALFGLLLSLLATSQLYFSELENRTVLALLAMPVNRTSFLLGKYLGVLALLVVFFAAMTSVLLWLLSSIPNTVVEADTVGRLVQVSFLHWLKCCLMAAMTLFIASYGQSLLFTALSALILALASQLQYLAASMLDSDAGVWLKGFAWLVANLLPDFQRFHIADAYVMAEAWPEVPLMGLLVYTIGYAAVYLALAAYLFRKREF